MMYKHKWRIKVLLAAGLLAFNLSGCKKEIQGYSNPTLKTLEYNTRVEEVKKRIEEFKADTERRKNNIEQMIRDYKN